MIIKLLCEIDELKITEKNQSYDDIFKNHITTINIKKFYDDMFKEYITTMHIKQKFFTADDLKTILKNIAMVYRVKEKNKIQ